VWERRKEGNFGEKGRQGGVRWDFLLGGAKAEIGEGGEDRAGVGAGEKKIKKGLQGCWRGLTRCSDRVETKLINSSGRMSVKKKSGAKRKE
jgi:hypothetical protein